MAEQWPMLKISVVMNYSLNVVVHREHNKSSDKFIIITPGWRLR